jgi:NitT/TauT family transport system permease protein
VQLVVGGELWSDVFATVYRLVVSFTASVILGGLLGGLMGYFKTVYLFFELLVDFFRSIPSYTLYPLFLLFLGIGNEVIIAVVVWVCSLIMLINVMYGVRNANRLRLMVGRTMKLKKRDILYRIVLPEAAPHIFAGLRLGLSVTLITVIVTEMLVGTSGGLGYRILHAKLVYAIPEVYVGILVAGILGYALNKSFLHLEHRVIHWQGKS